MAKAPAPKATTVNPASLGFLHFPSQRDVQRERRDEERRRRERVVFHAVCNGCKSLYSVANPPTPSPFYRYDSTRKESPLEGGGKKITFELSPDYECPNCSEGHRLSGFPLELDQLQMRGETEERIRAIDEANERAAREGRDAQSYLTLLEWEDYWDKEEWEKTPPDPKTVISIKWSDDRGLYVVRRRGDDQMRRARKLAIRRRLAEKYRSKPL